MYVEKTHVKTAVLARICHNCNNSATPNTLTVRECCSSDSFLQKNFSCSCCCKDMVFPSPIHTRQQLRHMDIRVYIRTKIFKNLTRISLGVIFL